jgi:hypothetical protein
LGAGLREPDVARQHVGGVRERGVHDVDHLGSDVEHARVAAVLLAQRERLGRDGAAADVVHDGAHLVEAEVDAVRDALRRVAGEEEPVVAQPAKLQQQRQLALCSVLHLVHIEQVVKRAGAATRGRHRALVQCSDASHASHRPGTSSSPRW